MDAVFKGHNLFVATPKSGDLPDLQFYYDVCLPGNSTILNKYDAVTMRLRDNSLNVKDCVLDFSKKYSDAEGSETMSRASFAYRGGTA